LVEGQLNKDFKQVHGISNLKTNSYWVIMLSLLLSNVQLTWFAFGI